MASQASVSVAEPIVKRYVTTLQEHQVRPESAYLFGSYVSGRATPDSDIDVAIVSRDLSGDLFEDTVLLMRYRWDVDLRIEPHPFRPEDFTPENPWVAEIIEKGIRII